MFWCKVYYIGVMSTLIFECVFTSKEIFSKTYKNSPLFDAKGIIQHDYWKITFPPNYQTSNFSFDWNMHPNSTNYLGYLTSHLKYIKSYNGSHFFASNYKPEDAFYEGSIIKFKNPVSSSNKYPLIGKFSVNSNKSQIHNSGFQKTKNVKFENSKVRLSSTKKKFYHKVHEPYVMYKYPAKKTVFSKYIRPSLKKLKVFPKHAKKNKNPQVFDNKLYINTKKTNHEYFSNLNSFDVAFKNNKNYYESDEEDLTTKKKTTTRSYYGDRIYMNALALQKNFNKLEI